MAPMSEVDRKPSPRVLVVEDEEPIREGLLLLLEQQGFAPDGAADGPAALEELAARAYDLVILDLMIPGVDGLEVLRRARASGVEAPVLILTARGAEEDVVAGLEAGADDYVTKPFGIRELTARAQALLRRSRAAPDGPRRIQVGEVAVDLDLLTVAWPGGELRLTAREGLLVEHLVARRHRPVSRAELLVDVWGYRDGGLQTRTVDVHVQQLRAKLAAAPGGAEWIETIRGKGYRFAAEVG
jgi:DNA-binding response OmpR family regulator